MTYIWLVFAFVAADVVLPITDGLPATAGCVGCALSLWLKDMPVDQQRLAGLDVRATSFAVLSFVFGAGMGRSGVTAWAEPGIGRLVSGG